MRLCLSVQKCAAMREEDKRLFPLSTIGGVVQLFRQQLTGDLEPDLTLLSIVAGCVENSMTSSRNITVSPVSNDISTVSEKILDYEEPEVADVENLRLDPPVELHIVEALCSKFESVIKGYCDLSLFKEGQFATRSLVKRVSDIIWNTLSKAQYKDRAHLQSIYSYLTGSKLDCFGVAFAVVAGCQVLGFSDVHLAISEDHAWVVFGEDGQTAEVTWHGKGHEDKRGQSVEAEKAKDSWLYVGGKPVLCTRHVEVAALVSSMSPSIGPSMDSLEVGVLQQELLWLLYDLGHLEKYPMALGNLGDLEEVSATPGRPPSRDIYNEAVTVNQKVYEDYHVYPYTYSAGFHYRQRDFKGALKSWAEAANVIKRYKYSKDDEEIYKEFMEINNELIPHILKADENLLNDPECFVSLLQFYDGLCSWEEDSSTPVLHIGWVKPIVKCFTSFDFHVRAKLEISLADREEGNEILSFSDWTFEKNFPGHFNIKFANSVPERLNNNYKESFKDCDMNCDTRSGHYGYLYKDSSIYEDYNQISAPNGGKYDFENMQVNRLLRLAKYSETELELYTDRVPIRSATKNRFLSHLIEKSGESLFNIDFLLGHNDSQPFLDVEKMQNIEKLCQLDKFESRQTKNTILPEEQSGSGKQHAAKEKSGKINVTIFSAKMGALKDLIQAEKLNSSALHLQLTAQSQTDVKKGRASLETELPGRVKRARRD